MSNAQHSSLHCFTVAANDSIKLPEHAFIEKNSIVVQSVKNHNFNYSFQYFSASRMILFDSIVSNDSLYICYRVFPIKLKQEYFLYDNKLLQQAVPPEYSIPEYHKIKKNDWWETSGINYSGSFIRGISTGNNQSLVLNSSLNLQLSGDLGDGYSILGAISDNQIPIQAEGNTRQIQEFDRLYLQIMKNRNKLTAGDFEIGAPSGYFIKYLKKNKGGMLETLMEAGDWSIETKSAVAVSKGKTNRINLKLQNGNQGPYRLYGNNGEAFIILLAGTEKIWLDGHLLERGAQGDYTIDYNLAELNFTANTVIHDQLRIIVEFEYLDQNYNRSLIAHQSSFKKNNTTCYLNVFHEQDSKRPAVEGDLDSLDQSRLAAIGDDIQQAYTSGVRKAGASYNVNRNYYRLKDTLVVIQGASVSISFYQFDPLADSSAFQIQFTELGPGNAHYRLKQSSANGRVYEWIAPDPISGNPQGSYDPVVPLIAPQRKTLVNGGIEYSGKNQSAFKAELAISSYDANRISSLQDDDNRGMAFLIDARAPVIQLWKSLARIKVSGQYEYVHKNFSPANSFRTVEFSREWNNDQLYGLTDHIPKWMFEFESGKNLSLKFKETRLIRSNTYRGTDREIQSSWVDSIRQIKLIYGWLKTDDPLQHTQYLKPEFYFDQQFGKSVKLQFHAIREDNKRYAAQMDSLLSQSFAFNSLESKALFTLDNGNQIILSGKFRSDDLVQDGKLHRYTNAMEYGLEAKYQKSKSGHWNVRFNMRDIGYQDERLHDSLSRLFFLGSVDHQIILFDQCLKINNFYELQSGVEPRIEFVFEERKAGEGDYIYLDFNGDGIRQLFEYVYAPDIDTAKFVRFQLLNSEYVQIYKSSWNQLLSLDFKNLGKHNNKLVNFLRAISLESSFRISSKLSHDSEFSDRINPLLPLYDEGRTIGHQSFMQQSLYFQRTHSIFELQFFHRLNGIKQLLTSGTDRKKIIEPGLKVRWSFSKTLDFYLEFSLKTEERSNDAYFEQNYKTNIFKFSPSYQHRINSMFRIFGKVSYSNVEEVQLGKERAKIYEVEQGIAAFLFKRASLRTNFKYLNAAYNGQSGGLLEYEILQGFKNGNNSILDIQFDYKINSYIQLSVSYTGRKAAANAVLHTGRMQLRANF